MTVTKLLSIARDKSKFKSVWDHIDFYQLLLKDYLIYSQYQLYPMSTLYKYELQFKRF